MKPRQVYKRAGLVLALVMLQVMLTWAWAGSAQGQGSGNQGVGGLQNGRFLLHQGTFQSRDSKTAGVQEGLFKIDTASGRVWKYEESARGDDDTLTAKWASVQGN